MGSALRRQYYTGAARAIKDAIRRSAIPLFEATGVRHDQMRVQVTIGVQAPDRVDCAALADCLPRGQAEVKAVSGGLDVTNPDTGTVPVIASAAVEAFSPKQAQRS